MGIDGLNNQNSFKSINEFVSKFDKSGDGKLDKDEIKEAQKYFKDAGITNITIDGVDYNLLTDENKDKYNDIKGGKGKDFILSAEADKIDGKGGDDIIFAADAEKIKGGGGDDKIYYSGDNAAIKGGLGKDSVNVSGYGNNVRGGFGKDQLDVDGHGNTVNGGFGSDNLDVDGDGNTVKGGGAVDYINVEGTANTVRGGSGNDKIDVKGNYNDVGGGTNFDTIKVTGDNNKINGNGGRDTMYVDGNNNEIKFGDWAKRSVFGQIVSFIPKMIGTVGIGLASVPFVFPAWFGNEKAQAKLDTFSDANGELWGDYNDKAFVNGKNNTVISNSSGGHAYDTLYVENEPESGTVKKGTINDKSSNPKDAYGNEMFNLDTFHKWLKDKDS